MSTIFKETEQENFNIINSFPGYVSKPEITNLPARFLVKGSKNVLIDYANRVISRPGYTLYNQANNGGSGIKSAFDWQTSIGTYFTLRAYDRTLEFDWNGTFNTLLTGLRSPDIQFAKVLDYNEQQDVLLFVNGDGAQMHRWGGGVSKVASSTSTTLKKQGVMTGKTTIAFVAGTPGSVAATITDSGNGFLTAGFTAGDTLSVVGSPANSANFIIGSIAAGVITLIMPNVLTSEIAGASITLYNQTGPTWKSAHFLSSISPRSITYKGVNYAYTGGEATDTLTGLTSFPTVAAGDVCWQTPDIVTLPSAITTPFPNFYPDLIGVQLNMLFLGSTKSQMTFGSKSSDYTNFTLTSPRAQGDPFQQPLTEGNCTCIVPVDGDRQVLNVQNTLIFGSGQDAFDQIDFHMSADNSAELLRIIRYKTAQGSGLISKNAIVPIKNNTVYISREPALTGLSEGNLESPDGKKNVPISDIIKNDFDSYDFTNSAMKYWKRSIYIALPVHGLVLIYDMMRNLWQPPATIPVSCFSINSAGQLLGHSSILNESYTLFSGTNDNGAVISQVARFAYNNGGSRTTVKNLTEYWSDGYISLNGLLKMNSYFGFDGKDGKSSMTISGGDASVTNQPPANPFGNRSLGSTPLGGGVVNLLFGLPGITSSLVRFWQEDTTSKKDFTEQFVEFTMNTLDSQFALVAYGSNMFDTETIPITHRK